MSEQRARVDTTAVETAIQSAEQDNLANNPEAQWLLKALHKMQGETEAGLSVADELSRLVDRYRQSGDSEQLINQAMGIVALVGLPYVRDGKLEPRDILEAAPEIIIHTAQSTGENVIDFSTRLAEAMEDFCNELCGQVYEVVAVLPEVTSSEVQVPKKKYMDALVLRAQTGDSYAANRILEKCSPMVWYLIKKWKYFLPNGDEHDLYQEGLSGILRAVNTYDPSRGSSFYNFAQLAALRGIITAVKAATRNKHTILNTAKSLSESPPPDKDGESTATLEEVVPHPLTDVERIVIAKEELSELDVFLLTKLTDMEYECIVFAAEDRSYEEISEITGYDLRSIDNALQRAKRKIKESGILS